ncbi:MAG: FecR domain-containing protein [Candidatus Omnitrophota bacterium]
MKRIFVFIIAVSFLLVLPMALFAQTAKVIDRRGQVMVKKEAGLEWEKVKLNMVLNDGAEVETKARSECILAFDEEPTNIVSVKENTKIKIESVKPGNIFLPQGRVFALVENLAKEEKFQVRTPTAIAGARGTGWVTGFNNGNTNAECFENTIFVQGLDENGNPTGEQNIGNGFGIDVGPGGDFGQPRQLGGRDFDTWDNFTDTVDFVIEKGGEENDDEGLGIEEFGLHDEQRQDYRDLREENRRDIEIPEPPSDNPPTEDIKR